MPVTIEQIRWCYTNLLGREPESTTILERHASEAHDFPSLVLSFVRCQEFLAKTMVAIDAPAMLVESDATLTQMSQLRKRIREAWTHLGETKPHYSVLTGEQFLPENVDKSVGDFWASGFAECGTIQTILKRHGFTNTKMKKCVEYGSGLGRVTCALADIFAEVHGYDISTAHLDLARRHAAEVRAANITFHRCSDDTQTAILEKCDFFYSRIVFQHNPPPLMRDLIVASLLSLNQGGIAVFQVPTYGWGYHFTIDEYLAAGNSHDMEIHCIPQHVAFSLIAAAGCEVLEVREDDSIGLLGRWVSNVFVVRRQDPSDSFC